MSPCASSATFSQASLRSSPSSSSSSALARVRLPARTPPPALTRAGYLLFYGNKTYTAGYFESTELYYGIAGLAVSVVALTLFFFLVTWMVLRISFVVTPTSFRVLKSGILRHALAMLAWRSPGQVVAARVCARQDIAALLPHTLP